MQALAFIGRWCGRVTDASRKLVAPYVFYFNPQEPDFLSLGYGATDTSGALMPVALQPNHLHEGASAVRLQKSTEERCWRYLLRINPESRPR
jgi:hypothetical protein